MYLCKKSKYSFYGLFNLRDNFDFNVNVTEYFHKNHRSFVSLIQIPILKITRKWKKSLIVKSQKVGKPKWQVSDLQFFRFLTLDYELWLNRSYRFSKPVENTIQKSKLSFFSNCKAKATGTQCCQVPKPENRQVFAKKSHLWRVFFWVKFFSAKFSAPLINVHF